MFLELEFNQKMLLLYNFQQKWYFSLAQFCNLVGLGKDSSYDYFQKSLNDFAAAAPEFAKRQCVLRDDANDSIVKYISNVSHKARLNADGKLENVDAQKLREHFRTYGHSVSVQFHFFCRYLQEMHQRWQERQIQLDMTDKEFCQHLRKRYKCNEWAHLLENIAILEPIAAQFLYGSEPTIDRESETDDLLHYLKTFKAANNNVNTTQFAIDDVPKQQNMCTRKSEQKNQCKRRRRTLTLRDRMAIAGDQKWLCAICEQTLDDCYQVDHIQQFSETGNDHYENLWALCPNCHAWKTEMDRRKRKSSVWAGYQPQNRVQRERRRLHAIKKLKEM